MNVTRITTGKDGRLIPWFTCYWCGLDRVSRRWHHTAGDRDCCKDCYDPENPRSNWRGTYGKYATAATEAQEIKRVTGRRPEIKIIGTKSPAKA